MEKKEIVQAIGNSIKKKLDEKGMSYRDIAKKTNISIATISRLVGGKNEVGAIAFIVICKELNIDARQILEA